VLQKVFCVGIKAADGPQKLRDLIDEFIRLTWARIGIHNLGKETSDVIDMLRLQA
jgi:hypothetical protein